MISGIELAVALGVIVCVYYTIKEDFKQQIKNTEIYKGENKCLYDYLYCTIATQGSYDPQCSRDCKACLNAVAIVAKERYNKGL